MGPGVIEPSPGARKLHFPLLADFEPKGAVAKSYGAYRADAGIAERALFVIDEKGAIFWSYGSPIAVNPGCSSSSPAISVYRRPPSSRLWPKASTDRKLSRIFSAACAAASVARRASSSMAGAMTGTIEEAALKTPPR